MQTNLIFEMNFYFFFARKQYFSHSSAFFLFEWKIFLPLSKILGSESHKLIGKKVFDIIYSFFIECVNSKLSEIIQIELMVRLNQSKFRIFEQC